MDELLLVEPEERYAPQIAAYRREFLERGDSLDGTSGLGNWEEPEKWLVHVERMKKRETCPEGLVPSTTLLCIRREDDKLVGMVDIRWELNDYLRQFGGHIGYSIRPAERRKGYGTAQLGLALEQCTRSGLDRVLLTCNGDNEGSRRVILHWGGELENEVVTDGGGVVQRYWVTVPGKEQT